MLKHIVCFKFKNKEQAPIVAGKLRALVGKIECLRTLECGENILYSPRSYDLVLIATFDSMEDYKAYDQHEEHLKVREYVSTVRESSVAVDYEL